MMTDPPLLVSRDWPVDAENVKAPILRRRLVKARAHLDTWRREVLMLETLLRRHCGEGARLLDVACGTGFGILELSARGFRTMGVDADPRLCATVRDAARHFDVRAHAVAGDACRLPLADGSFDAVMSRSFFEHVYDRDLAISEQLRVLRPGGLLLILDGNLLNPRVLLDLLLMYPLRTRGRHGGIVWLLTKRRVRRNLYGYLPRGRDEDVKTPRWWRRTIGNRTDCDLLEASTSARYMHPEWPRVLHPFLGSCQVVALKR
jgi:ubiquinone/menaquinone biosynthesis C-methylase UbiE